MLANDTLKLNELNEMKRSRPSAKIIQFLPLGLVGLKEMLAADIRSSYSRANNVQALFLCALPLATCGLDRNR